MIAALLRRAIRDSSPITISVEPVIILTGSASFDVALFALAPRGHGKIARGFQPLGPECEREPGAGSPWLLTITPIGAKKQRNIKKRQ